MKEDYSQVVLYQTDDGKVRVDVAFEDETVWLTQSQMGELFGKGRTTITEHIRNIFDEGELDERLVCREFRHTTEHGAIQGKTPAFSLPHVPQQALAIGDFPSLPPPAMLIFLVSAAIAGFDHD